MHLEQGSEEWKEVRRTKVTGTDAGIILGVNPFKTAYYLWQQKMGLIEEDKENYAMRMGRELEAEARELYETIYDEAMIPSVEFHKDERYHWAMASLDGKNLDGSKILEIKCGAGAFSKAKMGEIPSYYQAQMQHGMFVSGAKSCDYFCYDGNSSIIMHVERDDAYIKKIIKKGAEFYNCLAKGIAPEVEEKDYVIIDDDEAIEIAEEWKEVKRKLDEYKSLEKSLKEKLIEFSDDGNFLCNGVKATRVMRKGGTDYKKIIEDYNVDVSKYEKQQIGFYKLSEV